MTRRRRVIGRVLATGMCLVAVVAATFVLRVLLAPADTPPEPGEWTSTAAYAEAAPGAFGMVVRPDGRVEVTGAPPGRAWWAGGGHELWVRGDRLEVRSGDRVVERLRLRHRAGEMRLLDPCCPDEVIRLRKL
jgi:hypothetical protein